MFYPICTFSEAQSTRIDSLTFNKNLDPEIYHSYLREINQIALTNQIRQVDLVLAGDIFEITRSAFWFDGPYRPYVDNRDVEPGSPLEAKILQILDAIANEDKVKGTLLLFRTLEERFDVDVRLHYLVGNHDRLLNATPELRRKARALLGVGGGDLPLDHQFIYRDGKEKSFCLVRHGHEYDPMNFSVDTHALDVIPTVFSEDIYGNAPLGDITTIEFGAALPYYFIEHYGEDRIISNPILMALYQRLMDLTMSGQPQLCSRIFSQHPVFPKNRHGSLCVLVSRKRSMLYHRLTWFLGKLRRTLRLRRANVYYWKVF